MSQTLARSSPSSSLAPLVKRTSWGLIRALARLGVHWIPRAEVRAETWAIGARHRGQVVEGARLEGRAAGLSFRRAILLKAVIREYGSASRAKARKARA